MSEAETPPSRGPRVLEVRHLQLIAAIVDEGNLTRAGERLHLTQSALSHQLLQLEERLGTKVFHRIQKRLALNDAGQRLLATAREVLGKLAQAEDDLRLFADDRRGTIRLTTECYTVYHWLPSVMKRFAKRYPDVEIRIEVDATNAPFDALLAGVVDVAFVTTETAPRGIATEPLFDDEMHVIVAPEHPFASKPYVTCVQLAAETLLTYSTLRGNLVYERLLRPAGLEPKKHLQVQLTEALIELVKAHVGVAVMAQWAVAPYVKSGAVIAVPLTRRGVVRHWQAARLESRTFPRFVRSFVDLVAAEGPHAQKLAIALPESRPRASR
ncbi:MAG: LysR family transcriptional regulator [Acidobacteria bacterium]|nr:LysR family transcriptional regulator [Acidobacteriota bacterium]MBV9475117.1 LysR family transcriptional regulator [Acidobacteriota bacterium]